MSPENPHTHQGSPEEGRGDDAQQSREQITSNSQVEQQPEQHEFTDEEIAAFVPRMYRDLNYQEYKSEAEVDDHVSKVMADEDLKAEYVGLMKYVQHMEAGMKEFDPNYPGYFEAHQEFEEMLIKQNLEDFNEWLAKRRRM